jgi:hypothetical protein
MAAGDARLRGGFSYVRDFSSTANIHGDGTPAPEQVRRESSASLERRPRGTSLEPRHRRARREAADARCSLLLGWSAGRRAVSTLASRS